MAYLLVNFGGPRNCGEVFPFLSELLSDRDVIRTHLPHRMHKWLFDWIARRRTARIARDYEEIGGRSPIYFDTEWLCDQLQRRLGAPVFALHRYLPSTHGKTLEEIEKSSAEVIRVFPLFPQFCYATTGSAARFLQTHLSLRAARKLHWIQSYAAHPSFVGAYQRKLFEFLKERRIEEKDAALLFSAHGIPLSFVKKGDPYERDCQASFREVALAFPEAVSQLAYQSKFGLGKWLKPSTLKACEEVFSWHAARKQIVVVPLSFTSDHIETLFEIEKLYLPIIAAQGLAAHRCPALNREIYWVDAIVEILKGTDLSTTGSLVRVV